MELKIRESKIRESKIRESKIRELKIRELKNTEFTLNSYVDKVYVINMDADTDRLESVTKELDKVHTKFTRIPGIVADKGLKSQEGNFFAKYFAPTSAVGISEAHRKVWKTVVEKDYSAALCFEDDIKLITNISDIFPKAIEELPEDWDMLYLGCITCCSPDKISLFEEIQEKIKPTLKKYSTHLNTGGLYYGNEAYAISNKGAKKLLEQLDKINWHLDFDITYNTKNLNSFKIDPPVAYQNSDDSFESNNTSKAPVILNKFAKNISFNNKCNTNFSNFDWIMSISLFRFFSDALTFNLWSILFFILSFIMPTITPYLFGYLIIDIVYSKFTNLILYLPFVFSITSGYLLSPFHQTIFH